MTLDQARYSDGRRLPCADIGEELSQIRASGSADFLWIEMKDPTPAAFARVSDVLQLHPLAVDGSANGNQRPKIQRYGEGYVVVLRPLRYIEQSSAVESSELMVFLGKNHIVTVERGEATSLVGLRTRLADESRLLALGPPRDHRPGRGRVPRDRGRAASRSGGHRGGGLLHRP